MSTVDDLVAGAVGGLAAGLIMTAFMTAAKETGMVEQPVPLKFERAFEEFAGVEQHVGPTQAMVLSQAEHLAFSAALGAGYASSAPRSTCPRCRPGRATVWGCMPSCWVGLDPCST